jgi:hypothetical protein
MYLGKPKLPYGVASILLLIYTVHMCRYVPNVGRCSSIHTPQITSHLTPLNGQVRTPSEEGGVDVPAEDTGKQAWSFLISSEPARRFPNCPGGKSRLLAHVFQVCHPKGDAIG